MRYKVQTNEVAHLWAHQTQSHAEGGNMFFQGKRIFSYGYHFELARHITGTKSRRAVLINSETYSSSTSRHQRYVRSAISHMTKFYYPLNSLRSDMTNNALIQFTFNYSKNEIRKSIELASTARKRKEEHLGTARHYANQFNALAEFFGSRKRINLPENFEEMLAEAKRESAIIARREAVSRARAERARAEANRIALAEALESVPLWQSGDLNRIPNCHLLDTCYLRFIDDGKIIQTSLGVQFPSDHGKRAYRILKRLYSRGESYHRNGHTIHCGHYAIDTMDDSNIVAGCHKLTWTVLNEFADKAGWNENDSTSRRSEHPTGDNIQDERTGTNGEQTSGDSPSERLV